MSTVNEVEALLDGCDGDSDGLRAALGNRYVILESWGHDEGYGHHGYNTIYRTEDDRLVHAECGGCSCDGSGSWSYVDDLDSGRKLVPEWLRQEKSNA